MVPLLETARLRLREFRVSDLDIWCEVLSDPDVVRFLGGQALSREETWRKVLSLPAMWALFGFGYWVVERKADNAVIGQAGFGDFKRDLTPSIEGLPEMGWVFAAHAHGQGYASEAVSAALAWADAHLEAPEIPAIIEPGNAASIRLAERHGFAEREEARYKNEPILLLRRRRP